MAVHITLGNRTTFAVTDENLMSFNHETTGKEIIIGIATKENLDRLIENMNRLRIHMKES